MNKFQFFLPLAVLSFLAAIKLSSGQVWAHDYFACQSSPNQCVGTHATYCQYRPGDLCPTVNPWYCMIYHDPSSSCGQPTPTVQSNTPTPTPPPAASPTRVTSTPPPPPALGVCNTSCGITQPCTTGLTCQGSLLDKLLNQGICRNNTCPSDTDCACDLSATPSPTGSSGTTPSPSTTPIVPLSPSPTPLPIPGAITIYECGCSVNADELTKVVDEDDRDHPPYGSPDNIDDTNEVASFIGHGINFAKGNLTYYWEVDPNGGGGWDGNLPDGFDTSCTVNNQQSQGNALWSASDSCSADYRYSPIPPQGSYPDFSCQPNCPYQYPNDPSQIKKQVGPFDISLKVEGNYGQATCVPVPR